MGLRRTNVLICAAVALAAHCARVHAAPATTDAATRPSEAVRPTVIHVSATAGPQYDVLRFRVAPGERVRLELDNLDTMLHNLVITRPGKRIDVVDATMKAAGAGVVSKDFVLVSPDILFQLPMVEPGAATHLDFRAPDQTGVYPYVCTFPGHGYLMYGAMYVGNAGSLPPLEKDPNLPPPVIVANPDAGRLTGPRVQRTFLPDCGPAAIAVHVGDGVSFCFDAGQCRLRYAWKGGFIDRAEALAGNGSDMPKVVGRVWWREPAFMKFPFHIGASSTAESAPDAEMPAVQFHGYRLQKGLPEFHYSVDGVDIREYITPAVRGVGLVREFAIDHLDRPITLTTDPAGGAVITSSASEFTESGRLTLTPAEAKHFTITMTERAGIEPLAYWSMNDVPSTKGWKEPVPGVVGRALEFDGKTREIDTGINAAILKTGATLTAWVRPAMNNAGSAAVFGAHASGNHALAIGFDLSGLKVSLIDRPKPATQPVLGGLKAGTEPVSPKEIDAGLVWHHIAVTSKPEGAAFYVDGHAVTVGGTPRLSAEGNLFIGSAGGAGFFRGTLDEVRMYDRPLGADQVLRLFERDSAGRETPR